MAEKVMEIEIMNSSHPDDAYKMEHWAWLRPIIEIIGLFIWLIDVWLPWFFQWLNHYQLPSHDSAVNDDKEKLSFQLSNFYC